MSIAKQFAVAVCITTGSCAQVGPAPPVRAANPGRVEPAPERSRAESTTAPPSQTARSATVAADPQAQREAQELLREGLAAYHVGAYEEAETLLKRSITLYPFLAQANLALGKIFLLKGAATHDEALIQSARLMFDMAHNLDPALREPLVLLELFKPRAN